MLFIKILGSFFVALGGGSVCYFLYKKEYNALCQAEAWGRLVAFIGSQVECFSLPIGQILLRTDIELLRGCGLRGEEIPRNMKEFIRRSYIDNKETRTAAEVFCAEFGRGYAEEQTARCRYYAGVFEEIKKKLSAELPAKKKLYYTLCITASLAILIIFL